MNKIVVFIILLFSVLTGFAQTETDPEACKVYQAIISNDEKPPVIVGAITGQEFGKRWVFSKRNPKFAVVQSETLKSYKKDSYWCKPEDFVNLEPKKMLVTWDEAQSYIEKSLTDDNADKLFEEKYGNDFFYAFSNVGFNKKRDQALLTMQYQCISFRCTDWYYIVLSKTAGEWKIIRKEVIWSS